MAIITIDDFTITAQQVTAVARDRAEVALAQSSRDALKESRDYIEATWMHDAAPMM
jgi:histidine ammonia-lyase